MNATVQPKMNAKFAAMFKRAQKIREASYNNAAADAATAAANDERNADPTNPYAGMGVDYKRFYTLTYEQSAQKAAEEMGEPEMAEVLYLLMYSLWNDIEMWADEQLGIKRPVDDTNYADIVHAE